MATATLPFGCVVFGLSPSFSLLCFLPASRSLPCVAKKHEASYMMVVPPRRRAGDVRQRWETAQDLELGILVRLLVAADRDA